MCMTSAYLFCLIVYFTTRTVRRRSSGLDKLIALENFAKLWFIVNNSTNFIFYFMSGEGFRKAFYTGIRLKLHRSETEAPALEMGAKRKKNVATKETWT